jgi:hypothetical protein
MLAGTAPHDPPAWLAAIARNECLSRLRLRRRRPDTVELRDDDQPAASDVAELVDRRAEITALSEAIAGLPPAQRQAVILRDFYGLSYREVSLALGNNRVCSPIWAVLTFSAARLWGCQSSAFKVAHRKPRNRAETLTLCKPLPMEGLKSRPIERNGP